MCLRGRKRNPRRYGAVSFRYRTEVREFSSRLEAGTTSHSAQGTDSIGLRPTAGGQRRPLNPNAQRGAPNSERELLLLRFQSGQDHRAQLAHIACAESEDQVAFLGLGHHGCHSRVEIRSVLHLRPFNAAD